MTRPGVCFDCGKPTSTDEARLCRSCWRIAPRPSIDAAERFWALVDLSNPDGCWLWRGFTDDGYGRFTIRKGYGARSHRVAYNLMVGPIPAGLQLDHLCRNRACVNPAHLEPVTQTENVRRGNGGWNSRIKTHCPAGHPYDEANTYHYNDKRHCRTCRRQTVARIAARKRAAA